MLYNVGPLVFDLRVNVHEVERTSAEDFARKPIVGARQPLEHVGAGTETLRFTGKLFPERLGGAGAVEAMISIKESGAPQMVTRGDGKVLGWYVVTEVRHVDAFLDSRGAPRMIDVDLTLEKTGTPSAASAFGSLMSIFG